jgi:flagellar protein FlaJ
VASIAGLAYQRFGWLSKGLLWLLYGGSSSKLRDRLEAAGMRIYPEAYLSVVGLFLVLASALAAAVVALTRFIPVLVLPVIVLLLGYALPIIKAQDRASKLDAEAPFVAAYVSVMATGGLPPYASLRKLKNCDLLPNTAKVARQMEVDVMLKGLDPVAAIEKSAERLPSKEFREFLTGYTYTLRTGGDVVHYLMTRTEVMFRDLATKLKAFGERAAILLESYIAVVILSSLGLSIAFLISMAFRGFLQGGFTVESFLMYSYIVMPVLSIFFIYLADISSFQEPVYETTPYKVYAATMPFTFFLIMVMFLPFVVPGLTAAMPFAKPFKDFLTWLREVLGLDRGVEPAMGLGIALIVGTIPAMIAHDYYERRRGRGLFYEVANFLRDLTEVRKTGASPEACVTQLSTKPYGAFTKHLRLVARQLRWGFPFRVVYETLKRRISSWMALINLYILVDAIEVGGGTPETLETMARFGEMQVSLEKERMATLRPLMIMPYIGAALMVFSTLITVYFMHSAVATTTRIPIPFAQLISTIVPTLVLMSYIMGLVTGKIGKGSVSAGFRHAIVLTIMALATIVVVPKLRILMPF